MKTISHEALVAWLEELIAAGKADENFSISWFDETKNEKFAIIGGWLDGFDPTDADIFIMSKRNPCYSLCVKIAVNQGPYAYTDYELMDMPYDDEADTAEDTEVFLDRESDVASLAAWLLMEWERISKEYADTEFN